APAPFLAVVVRCPQPGSQTRNGRTVAHVVQKRRAKSGGARGRVACKSAALESSRVVPPRRPKLVPIDADRIQSNYSRFGVCPQNPQGLSRSLLSIQIS